MAQIDTHLRIAFSDALTLEAQQLDNRLGGAVMQETLEGERKYFDGYGSVAMTQRTSRSQANTYQEIGRDRRMIQPEFFEYSELFDSKRDEGRLMRAIEPNGPYSQAIAAAYHRKVDETIIAAFEATSFGGSDGTTSFAFDTTDQVIQQDFPTSGASTVGLTIEKLREARRILKTANAIQSGETAFMAVHPNHIDDLLAETEVTSSDFAHVKALVNGEVDTFMGFKFLETSLISLASATSPTVSYAHAFTADCMILGQEGALDVNIDDLPDRGHSTQFAAYATVAAVRRYENKIVRIECWESA